MFIGRNVTYQFVNKNEEVFKQGDAATNMYVVLRGQLTVVKKQRKFVKQPSYIEIVGEKVKKIVQKEIAEIDPYKNEIEAVRAIYDRISEPQSYASTWGFKRELNNQLCVAK